MRTRTPALVAFLLPLGLVFAGASSAGCGGTTDGYAIVADDAGALGSGEMLRRATEPRGVTCGDLTCAPEERCCVVLTPAAIRRGDEGDDEGDEDAKPNGRTKDAGTSPPPPTPQSIVYACTPVPICPVPSK